MSYFNVVIEKKQTVEKGGGKIASQKFIQIYMTI